MAVEPTTPQVDRDKIEQAVRLLLEGIGENPDREGLRETPARVARMWEDFASRRQYKATTFTDEDYDEMVSLTAPVYSFCEHHLLPFFGQVHIAYIPKDNRILGLSKLCRIVDSYALRPTIQERLTVQIAEELSRQVDPLGVGVIIEAEHLCMSMRGVQKSGHKTTTSRLLGVFKKQRVREEFLQLR